MALFPKCTFQVLVSGGAVVPGEKLQGELVILAPEPVPRATSVELVFESVVWVGYGSGKSRRVVRRPVWLAPFQVPLHLDPLPAGEQRFPFAVDVPSWLPPGLRGNDCGVEHAIAVRLDVDWAVDPKLRLTPAVVLPPRTGRRASLTRRSPPSFHTSLVLEVTLASSVLGVDEPLRGHIALRSGHEARFDAIELSLLSVAVMVLGQGDLREGPATSLRIPADALRSGEAVPFHIPPSPHMLPTFTTRFIDHYPILRVRADVPWASDPSFDLPLTLLPAGSTLEGETEPTVVGGERLRRLATAMAEATGLRVGRAPLLVEGAAGGVTLRLVDAPREGALGVDLDVTFPDVELGIDFRQLGLLDGFRASPLLPATLRDRYLLRCSPVDARAAVDDHAVRELLALMLLDLDGASELRVSDHHLGVHFRLPDDGGERMVALARASLAKAQQIQRAIAQLPFPAALLAARPAWEATASEQGGTLVPTGPTLHGLVLRARVVTGDERAVTLSIRTVWGAAGESTHVELDLRAAPVPKAAWRDVESAAPSELLRAVRAVFASTHIVSQGDGATLERPEATADPRALLSAVGSFFDWVLEVRGERRVDAPYR
jgi:hypothetical protein